MRIWQLIWERLGVLFLDQRTRAPIARMPVYAELSFMLAGDPPPVPLEAFEEQDDYLLHRTLGPILRTAIARALGEGGFEALAPQQRASLMRMIRNRLSGWQPNVLSLEPAEMRSAAEQIVEEAIGEAELPRVPSAPPSGATRAASFPLGFLATDHVGYASFDLRRVRHRLHPFGESDWDAPVDLALNVYPMGSDGERLDALAQARVTPEAVFAKFEIERPDFEPDLRTLSLPSMQDPSLADWYLSPGSFVAQPDLLLGADGCEALAPSQLSLQEYTFSQVMRLGDVPPGIDVPDGVRVGYLDEYRVSWHALGHSLGEISYSLPLAPGESVKLALVDWSWESTTVRREDTVVTEALLHETHRDRTIAETVRATLEEWQRGGTVMGGVAGSAGASGTSGAFGLAAGSSMALGGSYSTSSGSRALAGENVQRLADGFSQQSSSMRELTSTVVVQAHQEEHETIQTRTFTNYNHAHTLTILYYELLRHFRVVTEWVRRRPVALLPAATLAFDEAAIARHRRTLQATLLDPSLAPAFDALEKLQTTRASYVLQGIVAGPVPRPWAAGDIEFTLFELLIRTVPNSGDETTDKVVGFVRKLDGTPVLLNLLYDGPHHDDPTDLNSGDMFDDPSLARIFVKPQTPVRWRDIAGFEFEKWGTDEWRMDALGINAFSAGRPVVLVPTGSDVDLFFRESEPSPFSFTDIARPPDDPPAPPPIPTPEQTLTPEESRLIARLRAHLAAESAHYARAIALSRDVNDIARAFEAQSWDGSTTVLDHVEPYPLELFGDLVAYPLSDAYEDPDGAPDERREKLITFPARGVFAEGKLGHCNVAEEIDDTRFWKWEEHPIPVQAPEIAAATPVTPTPQATDARPTPFPSSLVNIVNPTAAPDPAGLAEALKVLGTPGIFRDMSGRAEVADLLRRLSDNTISIADAASRAKEIQGRYGRDLGGSGSGGGSPASGGGSGAGGSGPRSPSELQQFGKTLKSAVADGLMGNQDAGHAYQQAVDGYVQADYQVPPGSSADLSARLQADEKARRAALTPAAVARFKPSREDRLVGFGVESAPPEGLTVVNWARSGLDHYGSMWRGRRIGGWLDVTSGPATYPLRTLPKAIVVHETTGWARVGAGIQSNAREAHGALHDLALSVHFTVGPDGTVYQHNDIAQILDHATKANGASIGIEITNTSVFDPHAAGSPSATPSGATLPVSSEQTNELLGPTTHEDRERLPVAWINGTTGPLLYTMPPHSQMEAAMRLIAWLCPGNVPPFRATFLDASQDYTWRQHLVRASQTGVQHAFLLHNHPVWTEAGYDALEGIYCHANFSDRRSDGGPFALYAWLRLWCGKSSDDAYAAVRDLLSDPSHVIPVEVAPGKIAHGVNVASFVPTVVTL